MPTEVSSADDATAGSPVCSAICRQRHTPPSGLTFSTTMSAADRLFTLSGPPGSRMDSSAAMGTSTRRRRRAMSSTEATGCSAYSSPCRPSARSFRVAWSTLQAPLTSTRMRPPGPSASRTASTRVSSPGSPTLTFAVEHPDAATSA